MSQTTGRTKTLRTSRNAIKIINQAVMRYAYGPALSLRTRARSKAKTATTTAIHDGNRRMWVQNHGSSIQPTNARTPARTRSVSTAMRMWAGLIPATSTSSSSADVNQLQESFTFGHTRAA